MKTFFRFLFFSSRRRHTSWPRDWSSDVCSSDLGPRPTSLPSLENVTLVAMAQTHTRNLGRLSEIAQVAVRHGFGYFFESHRLTDLIPGHRTARLTEAMENGNAVSARGQHLRERLDELGPTFGKFGQLLSMRPDIVPPDIVAELRALQDDVRPFPFEQAE